ncbi:GNAT family N-acetyltransferase [Deinococcus sp.]|uniref:GNAT family N-acetyltransferase n=1 Tax=Deinococcus sp. TaxID=47478 RepID=UPI003CC6C7BD
MLELKPMTASSFRRFHDHAAPQYAAEKVRSGEWDAAGAQARAEGEFRMLLPQQAYTPYHFLYDLHDAQSGEDVGVLWYALRDHGATVSAFVYEIEIHAAYRRQGYATQAFGLLERDAALHGAGSLQLHVFGHNHGARALYERLGFLPTNLILRKEL